MLLLSGCSYQIDIRQGNIVTEEAVAQLKTGMNKRQVLFLLGSPLLTDPFHQDRWDYYYSLKPGGEEVSTRYRVTLHFSGDTLERFTTRGDVPEEVPMAGPAAS